MAGTGLGSLRVKLDLSDFVLDGGSHRWMLLPAERFRTVSDLAAQLRRVSLQTYFFFFCSIEHCFMGWKGLM